ncbi:hypothetical protein P43SY_004467 [Pythium insidiosum]|uniref:Uncharacterized protein n=1 Tax=Pythium insidiosum TaxID=114742 RepID=A0AAD5M6R4_PYTIN|nr:hypothetical protein P43SY_004467 [Pythium insidiosum]
MRREGGGRSAGSMRTDIHRTEREHLAPVDDALTTRVTALEKELREKESAVQTLRESVPRLAAAKTKEQLERARKRSSDVLVVMYVYFSTDEASAKSAEGTDIAEENVTALKESYEQTTKVIAATAARLDEAVNQTAETITVVQRAMKRPKTAVDLAMEKSPAKLNMASKNSAMYVAPSVDDNTDSAAAGASGQSLRSRLAIQLCTAKNI